MTRTPHDGISPPTETSLCWPLARVHEEYPRALTVWVALLDLATERGSPVITPTRKKLAEMTGITRYPTLTRALSVLDRAGWIQRSHILRPQDGPQKFATVMRIVLRRSAQLVFLTKQENSSSAQSLTVRNSKCSLRRPSPSEQKTFATRAKTNPRFRSEQKVFSDSSSPSEKKRTLSLSETRENPFSGLIRQYYQVIGIQTPSQSLLKKGEETMSELREAGRTVEEIQTAIEYVRDNFTTFDRPPSSIGLLPYIIEKAVTQARSRQVAEKRRVQLKEEDAKQKAQMDREARELGYTSLTAMTEQVRREGRSSSAL